MRILSNHSVNTKFNIIAIILLTALFLGLAFNSYRREQELILSTAVDNARSIAHQIIETRDYLSRAITNEPERNYNLIPQVAATRIARQLTNGSHYSVRQVSLRYRNPDNRPDSFEAAQLSAFRDSTIHEIWQIDRVNGKKALRYLLPMKAESSCLACHGNFDSAPRFVRERFPRGHYSYGYRVGEVIGAVSVQVPMGTLYGEIGANLEYDLIYDGAALLIYIFVTGWLIRKTILKPVKGVATSIADVTRTGNFSERLEVRSSDEIGELIGSFNELMAELDRKTLQRKESEDRYRNFIEIAQSPIVTFMGDGKIVISNQKAEKLFGLTKQELLGQSIFEFMKNGDELRTAITGYFNSGNSDLIGETTRQTITDVCGRLLDADMVISVSQADQNPIFSAILRPLKSDL